MTAIFVGSGETAIPIRRVHEAFGQIERAKCVDLVDIGAISSFDEGKHLKMRGAFGEPNPVLVLGLIRWVGSGTCYEENNASENTAVVYASGAHNQHERAEASAICIVTNSLDKLDPLFSLKRQTFERREKVRLVALYGQKKGRGSRDVYESLIRRFHNLRAPDFLCCNTFDDKAARLVASRICSLV